MLIKYGSCIQSAIYNPEENGTSVHGQNNYIAVDPIANGYYRGRKEAVFRLWKSVHWTYRVKMLEPIGHTSNNRCDYSKAVRINLNNISLPFTTNGIQSCFKSA